MWGRLVHVLLVGSLLGLAACESGSESSGGAATSAQRRAQVAELDSVLDLRATFNDDRGTPRLLLLLSPT